MRNKLWLAVFVSVGLTFLAPVWAQVCIPPPSGMVSWWPGDGNSNDIRDSNDGVLQNDATFANGFVGQSFSFNGSGSYVEVPDSPSLQLLGALSVDFWVYPTEHVVSGIVTKVDNAEEGAGWHVGYYGTNLPPAVDPQHVVFTINQSSTTNTSVSSSANSVPFNTWTHIAATSDGTTMRLYINGIQVDSAASPLVLANTFTTLFGAYQRNGIKEQFFNGLVDEIEFFNRALTASEIQAIFSAGSAGKCKDADGDSVPDTQDDCPNSIVAPTVVIRGCDSGAPNSVSRNGCTISDRIQQCAAAAQNHGQWVSCVAHLTNELKKAEIITGQQEGAIQRCAAQANMP